MYQCLNNSEMPNVRNFSACDSRAAKWLRQFVGHLGFLFFLQEDLHAHKEDHFWGEGRGIC